MSLGRGRRDLDGLTGDFAAEEQRRQVAERAARRPYPRDADDYDQQSDAAQGHTGIVERIRRLLRR